MPAPDTILKLCDNFARHLDHYKKGKYNETQVRREFLDPFFKALGWDVDNEQGYADAYKDVIHEDAIKIGGYTKAPDYCFRIGGTRKFFLEAKKPSVNIKDDIAPAYQLRRYAWSAKLPLSILSDFEELAIYDCRVRPGQKDKSSTARVKYFTFDEYAERWDEIESIFSRDAILKGSFDKYAESSKKKRGTAEVDDAFLEEIERWRTLLARNFALRNDLDVRDINYAVQKTIDRLIFLRMCEDRGTEDYGRLMQVVNGTNCWDRLREQFTKADDRYNSGLFHFTSEKGRVGAPDTLTPSLKLDDKCIKDIVKHLYYPESPYEFSVLPADILGQVYEQFLGKTIRLTSAHQAKIEEKPEVRKAGGVYYTPKYIVDYIVENTLGRLLNGIDPEKTKPISTAKAAKLKVLDPACGSGSFLIVAYQYLLDWHRDQYTLDAETKEPDDKKAKRHAAGKNPKIYQARGDEWKLTTSERKRILLNNIHGVDIDSQAVEVTKLSLLLKVLEGETQQVVERDWIKERQRILPDLGNNIQCGNSLIGPDFYDQPDLPEMDDETRYRINVFDWEKAFPEVFEQGGFDCVVGNPPYVDVKILPDSTKSELKRVYKSATKRFDLYVPFVEKGLSLLNQGGYLSYILPTMFMSRDYGADLREVIASESKIAEIVDFGTNQIFSGALNYVSIITLTIEDKPLKVSILRYDQTGISSSEIALALNEQNSLVASRFALPQTSFGAHMIWELLNEAEAALMSRLFQEFPPLGSFLKYASEGIHSGKDEVFFLNTETTQEKGIETPPMFPLAKGKDVHRYEALDCKDFQTTVIYPYDLKSGLVIPASKIESNTPNTWKHFLASRSLLQGRGYFDRSSKKWYELWCPRDPVMFMGEKIVGPEIANKGEFSLAKEPLFTNNKLKIIVPTEDTPETNEYILGLLNSSLLTYLHRLIAPPKSNNYFEVKTRILKRLPVKRIDFKKPTDVQQHDKMVGLVERMLTLNENKASEKNPEKLRHLESDIQRTDRQIDRLVYDLYELSAEEIQIVENGS